MMSIEPRAGRITESLQQTEPLHCKHSAECSKHAIKTLPGQGFRCSAASGALFSRN